MWINIAHIIYGEILVFLADDASRVGRLLELRVGEERAAAGEQARTLRIHLRLGRHGRLHHRRNGEQKEIYLFFWQFNIQGDPERLGPGVG